MLNRIKNRLNLCEAELMESGADVPQMLVEDYVRDVGFLLAEIDRMNSALTNKSKPSTEIYYVGAVALLGRLSDKFRHDQETLYCIEAAIDDLIKNLPGRFEKVKTTGGWSLEPIS